MPRRSLLVALASAALLAAIAPASSVAQAPFQSVLDSANPLGLTITNYGIFGNNFSSSVASFEYPRGSGYEHLPIAGLWIGATAADDVGPFAGVVTGAIDASVGTATSSLTEWTPTAELTRRSRIVANPYYSPAAVSDLDVLSTYDDHVAKRPSGSSENHRPMGVTVNQRVYGWDTPDYGHVLFLRFVIQNTGANPLTSLWAGVHTEFASGNRNAYTCWPPSSSCGPGSWYSKKWVAYDDTMRLVREHYCANLPIPSGCNLAAVPPWVGLKLLTRPTAGQAVTLAAWSYAPGDVTRDEDIERYALMSSGTIADLGALPPQFSDPVELLALGPFAALAPGDSITVDFALLGGGAIDSLQGDANRAQRFHDTGEFDQITPVAAALVSAEARPEGVRLVWSAGGASGYASIERRTETSDWATVGTRAVDGDERVVFEDHAVTPGERYAYRLQLDGGAVTPATWVEVPRRADFALHGARPNPLAGGDPVVAFALASDAPAALELFDLLGRRVRAARVESPQPGEHLIRLVGSAPLAPGVYTVRLVQGERRATARLSVVR